MAAPTTITGKFGKIMKDKKVGKLWVQCVDIDFLRDPWT